MLGVKRQTQPVTGAGAMDYTFTPDKEFVFEGIRLHLDAASATVEDFVIQLDSSKGSLYDVKLYAKDMNTVQDLIYQPEVQHGFMAGDSLKFTWANTNLKTWGMEIVFKAST